MTPPPPGYVADLFPSARPDDPRLASREHMDLSNIVRLSGTAVIIWREPSTDRPEDDDLPDE